MATQTYSIDFNGYWIEPNKGSMPDESGIYVVYSCVYNQEEKNVSLKKLIYIGESENVRTRVGNHERLEDWKKHLKSGEVLCYTFGKVSVASRERCEAALIFKHKPTENTEHVDSFGFDQTTISLSGKTHSLTCNFTVSRT